MSAPRFSVENDVLVNMLMVMILVAGGIFAFTLVRDLMPESRPDKLAIMAVYPGVQPREIEKAVTIKIEEAVRDIDGIEEIESTVSEGISYTNLSLFNEVDNVDSVLQEVKNAVDALQSLPDDVEQVTIQKFEPKLPVIAVAIYGDGTEMEIKRAAQDLRDDLLLLPGIHFVEINAIRDDEISVEVRPECLLEYDITFAEVAAAIRQTNVDVSGGQLKGDRNSINVRTLGEETRAKDLEDIVVRTRVDGRKILVSDVAIVKDQLIEADLEAYYNGKPAVSCVVYKTQNQDAIQISTSVKAYISAKQNQDFDAYGFDAAFEEPWYSKPLALTGAGIGWFVLKASGRPDPADIYEASRNSPFRHKFSVDLHTDLARFVEGRLDLMKRNGRTGLILVLLSLLMFLNWRVAFWASIGLLVSILGTFVVMWAMGVTLNLLSLFGMIIVLGIIVDDAIVIGENIYRHVENGMSPKEAAVRGAEEVMWPVIIAVLTTIAAFAPLFAVKGRIGDFIGELPIVVLAALTVSLIEALIILPVHLSHLPSKEEMDRREARSRRKSILRKVMGLTAKFQETVTHGPIGQAYEAMLRFTLKWRYATVAVSVALLLTSFGLPASGIVDRLFIQKMDAETLLCFIDMPVGTPSSQLKQRMEALDRIIVKSPEVSNVQSFVSLQIEFAEDGAVGAQMQSHLGQMIIELKAADAREQAGLRSSEAFIADIRRFCETLTGVNSITWTSIDGGPVGADIEVRFTGDDFDEIIAVGDELKAELRELNGVFDLDDDFDEGKREVQLRLRESARPTGITVGTLGTHVRSALFGQEARRITRNREDVKIMVRYPRRFRENMHNLESMWIPTAPTEGTRGWVPLGEVAELTETDGFTAIHRSQLKRSVTVSAEVDDAVASANSIVSKIKTEFGQHLAAEHPGVRMEFVGSQQDEAKAFESLGIAAVAALLLIYTLLAGLFRSYWQPIVVMSAIPFGILGAIVGHWITGNPLTVLSGVGLVALTGILVNDSIVLVDFINKRVASGKTNFEASVEGAKLRLRPIILTTLTTVAGLTPLMFETSFQAIVMIPMAVTLTFGLIFATALTLIIVPSMNLIFFDIRTVVQNLLCDDDKPVKNQEPTVMLERAD
ncbi:MAG: hypothetical protein CMJ78_01180 [Planctomycetaceae bacterium]|nr:hypothetical protein [Planctomycetaceae bacterium]